MDESLTIFVLNIYQYVKHPTMLVSSFPLKYLRILKGKSKFFRCSENSKYYGFIKNVF